MVNFNDPSKSDVSLSLLKRLFYTKTSDISLNQRSVEKLIEDYFSNDRNLSDIEKYGKSFDKPLEIPKINILSNCQSRNKFNYSKRSYYPIYYNEENETLDICSNLIIGRSMLNENLDREISLYNLNKNVKKETFYDNVASNLLKACEISHRTYFQEKKLIKEANGICAKYNMKYGNYNIEKYPFDVWVRFVNKKINELNK